jgi:hypothetical protein
MKRDFKRIDSTRSLRKVSDLFIFCKNLVDFNEARLHETTLNLHIRVWIFSQMSIASVDGRQYLSEVVFSAHVGFSLYIMSTHHSVKQSAKSTTGMSSVAYVSVVQHKRPELWSTGNWRLHHDNAPAHSLHLTRILFGKIPDFGGD